jgi:putative copper export protein
MLDVIAHTLHVILAGAWLGGVVFTTTGGFACAEVDGVE